MTGLPDNFVLTEEISNAFSLIEDTNDSVFITGKAGTGKSTFLEYLKENTKKSIVYLASTGVAALNIKGKTIHSFFRFPPRVISEDEIKNNKYRKEVLEIFDKFDTIVIDEISMVRADVIDGIDYILKKHRIFGEGQPFGGVQMVFIGDLFQLPPVISNKEKVTVTFKDKLFYEGNLMHYFEKVYKGWYFFNARAFRKSNFTYLEFCNIFRQKDDIQFMGILNGIRENKITGDLLMKLNERVTKKEAKDNETRIILCTTNATAKNINENRLSMLSTEGQIYQAELTGKFKEEYSENEYPVDKNMLLKTGSQVILVKNDMAHRWVNGSMGKIKELKNDSIVINIDGLDWNIEKETWEAVEYAFDEQAKKISAKVIGTFKQYPVKLAWAITIHKSQGKTFDKVTIDLERGAFAHGQTYVALSRCRTLDGVLLTKKIRKQDIIIDSKVIEFHKRIREENTRIG